MAPKLQTPRKGVAQVHKAPSKASPYKKTIATDFDKLPSDLNKWKNDQLKDLCRHYELKVGGNKADLIKRIKYHEPEPENSAGEDELEEPKKVASTPKKSPASKKKSPAENSGSGKSATGKKAPANGYRTEGGKTLPKPSSKAEDGPPLKARSSEIARAKKYRTRVFLILQQIEDDNSDKDDTVFDDVVVDLDGAKKELLKIVKAVPIDEVEDEVKEGEEIPSSPPVEKRDREAAEDEDYQDDDRDGSPPRKRSKDSEGSYVDE